MKKLINILLIVSILLSLCNVGAGAKSLIIRPYADYYSDQNTPEFSWTYTRGATYSLKVARNKAMTKGVVEITGLKKNLYNFSEPFEPGEYWWCFKTNSGSYSTPSRFYIAENSWDYSIPYDYENIKLNLPAKRPRLLFNEKNLEDIKKAMISEESYYDLREDVELEIAKGNPVRPALIYQGQISSEYSGKTFNALKGAMLYLMTGSERYKKYTLDMLEFFSETDENGKILWAPENIINPDSSGAIFNPTTDVFIVLAAYNLALCFDWLYNDMDAELRAKTVNLIESILKPPADNWTQDVAAQSKNIYMGFTGAHIYRLNQATIAALSIYEEAGEGSYAHQIVNRHLPVMINFTSPFTYQDGGNAQGNFYGVGAEIGTVHQILANLGIIDIGKKAASRNHAYRYIYNWNTGERAVFGDGYNDLTSSYHYGNDTQQIVARSENKVMAGVNKWLLEDSMEGYDFYNYNHIGSYLFNEQVRDIEAVSPYMLPTARYFKDIGWVSLNSDLSDEKRISLKFKSSPYGSYNHSHPDQNSFVINAFGEYMLTDADYYDAMHSTFDLAWNKKTYAHNAITFDNGVGQPYNDYRATGDVTGFLNNTSLDLITGDATAAYNVGTKRLEKAVRNIIWVKPDAFIIVDDLKSFSGTKSFEFWLNTRGVIDDVENGSATVTSNNVTMFTDCVYPSVTAETYIDTYNGPDGTVIDSSALTVSSVKRDADAHADSRIVYKTNPVEETKIINVLSFVEGTLKPVAVRTSEGNGYVKLTLTDRDTREQTLCYVNTGATGTISDADISFVGDAAVISPDGSKMLVNGTYLIYGGETIVESDVNVSAAICGGKVSLSNIGADANIRLKTGAVSRVHKTEDEREVELTEGVKAYGLCYENEGEYTTFEAFPGTYTLNLNDTLHEGYGKLSVSASEGGKIIGTDRRMKGMKAEFTVQPDEGYALASLTLNGEELELNSKNTFTTPKINGGEVIRAEFVPLSSAEPEIVTEEKVFSLATPEGMNTTVFGSLLGKGLEISDFGILYSSENKEFTLSDADGKKVRKLAASTENTSEGNKFGITVNDKTGAKGKAYARAYMKAGNNYYYGNIINLSKTYGSEIPLISELEIMNGKLSPEFSGKQTEYVVATESGILSSEDISFKLAPGASADVSVNEDGKSASVTVTSENGNSISYTFRTAEEGKADGVIYATENTRISHRASERDKDVYDETSSSALFSVYQYRLGKTNNYDLLLRFNLEEINPFAENINLQVTCSLKDTNLAGYKVAVHDVICGTDISLNNLTYSNSFGGSGDFKKGEKTGVLSYDEMDGYKLRTDITDYLKKKYAAGEKEVTLLLIADESSWPEDFSGDKLKILYLRPLAFGAASSRPLITWEGE